jgi:hypothetical protein
LAWVRVAVPLAAAAAIALLFVGPVVNPPHPMVTPEGPAVVTTTFASSHASVADADCNGDGVVNGDDIDCFIRRQSEMGEASVVQTEAFTRRLLGI